MELEQQVTAAKADADRAAAALKEMQDAKVGAYACSEWLRRLTHIKPAFMGPQMRMGCESGEENREGSLSAEQRLMSSTLAGR